MKIGKLIDRARQFLASDERGQTLVEYALIVATISIGVTAAMLVLREQIAQVFSSFAPLIP
jgi:Flp pilus assembly pilin Flp